MQHKYNIINEPEEIFISSCTAIGSIKGRSRFYNEKVEQVLFF